MTSRREKQLLDYIEQHIRITGIAPTYAEMAHGIGLKSKSSIARLIEQLIERSLIRRQHGKHARRSIVLTGRCPACGRGYY